MNRIAPVAGLLSRILAATLGGYALTWVAAALIALLPEKPAGGVFLTASLAPLVMILAMIWVFAARTAWRAWAGLLLPTLALAGIIWLAKGA